MRREGVIVSPNDACIRALAILFACQRPAAIPIWPTMRLAFHTLWAWVVAASWLRYGTEIGG
jgi:hypothetical protein